MPRQRSLFTALHGGRCCGLQGALLLLLYSALSRVLLVYVLPTMGARLTFICQSNLPGNLSVAISLLVACTAWVVALGGLLHNPTWGFLLLASGPVCVVAVLLLLSTYYYQATLLLHRQCYKMLHHHAKVAQASQKGFEQPTDDTLTLRLYARDRPTLLERSTLGANAQQPRRQHHGHLWRSQDTPAPAPPRVV